MILLAIVMFYIALLAGAIWSNQIDSAISALIPESLITMISITWELFCLAIPPVLAGLITGFCLALYRGGSAKPALIICATTAIGLLVVSTMSASLSITGPILIFSALAGLQLSSKLDKSHWINQLLGQISEEDSKQNSYQERRIKDLNRENRDLKRELDKYKVEEVLANLPRQIEEHERLFAKSKAIYDSDWDALSRKKSEYKEAYPQSVIDWEKHLASVFISLNGARDNLSSAKHAAKVAGSLNERGKYSVALTTSNIALSELEFMVGNLDFVVGFHSKH